MPAVRAVMGCGLAAGCTAAAAPAAAGPPAGAPFVYVTGKGGTNEISQFASLGSGALRPLTPRNVASGEFPYGIAVSPQGTSAYAVNNLSDTTGAVSQYTLDPATGKLTPKSPAMVATAGVPSGIIAISPDGKNAYVPAGQAISRYRISPATGKLTPMPPRMVAGAGFPIAIKVAPGGRYLYITSGTNCKAPKGSKGSKGSGCAALAKASTVSVFRISPATGALSARPVQTLATGQNPQMITIAPDGTSAYVTGGNTIWQYTINPATGKLTTKSPATVATGQGAHDLAVAPDGKNLYVVTVATATIAQYAISPATGALSARPVSTARTVPAPEAIALSHDGKNAYVTSEGEGALSQFAISPVTGKITPLSPATVTAPAHGSLGVAVTP
jgi:DNA-binding beta-propeller fold protein YncE